MPTAQEIYDKLVKDPDLEISNGQSREEAAEGEAQYRARQFINNVAALSLATQEDEPTSSIKALMNQIKNIGKALGKAEPEKTPPQQLNLPMDDSPPPDNQEAAAQAKVMEDIREEVEQDFDEGQKFAEEVIEKTPPKKAPLKTGKDSIGKPHVMFGSWGYKGTFTGENKGYEAHSKGGQYGLCNEFGQLNKVGQLLFDKMHEDGLLNNTHVMTIDTHCVVQPKGIQALLDHYEIDFAGGATLAKAVAEDIAGQQLSQEIIDEPTADWDSLAEQIAGKIPEGGAKDITPEVVEQTSEAINIPAEPQMPEGANPKEWHESKVLSHATRLQAAHETNDQDAIDKQQDLFNVSVESAQNENVATEKELATLSEPVFNDNVKDSALGEAFGGLDPETDWSGDVAQGVETSDEEEATSDVSTSTPTETPTAAKTSPDTKKTKVMESLFGDDIDSEDAQIYSDHLDDNPGEVDAAYKQHVVQEIVAKQKQKTKDAAKAKVDEQKKKEKEDAGAQKAEAKEEADAAKAKIAEEKQQAKEQAKAEKEQAKQEAVAQKKKEQDANTLPYEIDELELDEDGNPINKIADEEATHKALELTAHLQNHQDDMTAENKKKVHDSLVNANAHGADFDKIKDDFDEMGDDFGSPEHLQQALKDHQDGVEKSILHEEMVTGAGEHADSVDHAFENGHSNKYTSFNSQGEPDKSTYKQDGKDDKEFTAIAESPKTRHNESGEALHDAHPLASMSPFEKEKFKDLKEAKAAGDEGGVEKAKKALEEVGFDTSKLDVHEDDQPKTGPPNPEVAKRKMADGYMWHEETRHWILKETLDDLHGQHGSAQLGNTASIVDAGHLGAQGGGAFALDEHGNASGSQFVLHGGGKLHQIGSGETPKGAAHYSQITGNSLKHHLGDTLDGHNAKGGGVTKLKGFDSKSGKLTDNIQYGKGIRGQVAQGFESEGLKIPSIPSKRKVASTAAKVAAAAATGGASLVAEAAWKKFSPKFSKSEDSALDLFIKEYSPQDVMSTRDLLEYVSKPKPKKVESGYNKEREETHV